MSKLVFFIVNFFCFFLRRTVGWGRKIYEDQHKCILLKVLNLVCFGNKHQRDHTLIFLFYFLLSFLERSTISISTNDTNFAVGVGFPFRASRMNFTISYFTFLKDKNFKRTTFSRSCYCFQKEKFFCEFSKNCLLRNVDRSLMRIFACLKKKNIRLLIILTIIQYVHKE